MRTPERKRETIAFFGHFNATNFGNEATFQAILHNLRRAAPGAEFICISSGPFPEIAAGDLNYIPVSESFGRHRSLRNPLLRALQKICIATPSEVYRWIKGFASLRRADALIVPGGGLLTDAFGLRGCGPYNMFKWALIAKLCRCKLLFVSVGAGPLYGMLGRTLVRSALSFADFRSYRDDATRDFLERIGFRSDDDRVYPDLAFSLFDNTVISDRPVIADEPARDARRPVVGVGLMADSGRYASADPNARIYHDYRNTLVQFVRWLLERGYDVRLIIGDMLDDMNVTRDFKQLLAEVCDAHDMDRVFEEPVCSVSDLLHQIASTDLVVATRFHNVIFALLCRKPVISLSFHNKCASLMRTAGLTEYCLRFDQLTPQALIERFCDLERNQETLKAHIAGTLQEFREALDEQYAVIADSISPRRRPISQDRSRR